MTIDTVIIGQIPNILDLRICNIIHWFGNHYWDVIVQSNVCELPLFKITNLQDAAAEMHMQI